MKKILLFICIVCSFAAKAQFPNTITSGNSSTLSKQVGAYGANLGFVWTAAYSDTTAANLSFIKNVPGIVIRIGNDLWMRSANILVWIKISGGSSVDNTDSLFGGQDNLFATNRAVNMNGKSFRWTDADDFGNYLEYKIQDDGYLEYQLQNVAGTRQTFSTSQPGYINIYTLNTSDGSNPYFYLNSSSDPGTAGFGSILSSGRRADILANYDSVKINLGDSGRLNISALRTAPSTAGMKVLLRGNGGGVYEIDKDSIGTTSGGNNISNADLTSDANHTLDFNSFTQTYTGGTELHDSLSFTNTVIYPIPDSLFALGDSYTNPGSNASGGDSSYIGRYKNLLGLTLDNQGVSGRGTWQATANANANLNPGHNKMTTFLAGFNDVRRGGGDARTYNKVINGIKNIFIDHYLQSYKESATGSGIIRYGTWNTSYPASTVGGKSNVGAWTLALNDSITYSFTGSNVVFTIFFGDGTTEVYTNSFEVYIDDILQGTYSANYGTDAISDGSDGNTRQPGGFIYTGLTYGSHKIKVINKENSKYLIFDYFGHLVDLNHAYPFVIFHAPKIDATGYATSPANASNAIIDALNGKIDSLVATFPSGYPVYVAPTNSFYTNTTASGDLDVSDHIHPTDQGHRHIYDAAISVFSEFPTITGLPNRVFWSGDRPYVFDDNGQLRALVYFDESANVAGSNKQVQYNNDGIMGGATGFEVGNTNNRVLIESQATTEKPLITKGFAGQTAPHYQAQSSAGTPLFSIDASGGFQVLGALTTPIGSGSLEIEYSGGAYITSYNRGGSSWQPINFRGSTLNFLSSNTNRLAIDGANVTWTLGSDATGDLFYRNSSGYFTRLPIGTTKQKLGVVGGIPAWVDSTASGKPSLNKGVFIASATSADTIDVWQTPVAITITSLKAILRGTSPSVTYNIGFGTNIQSPTAVFTSDITCTSITTGCSNSSGFNDATIPAGSFIWIYITAASGTIRSISFTINYTED